MNKQNTVTEVVVPASRRYKLANAVAEFANHRLGGVVKNYMAREMKPQKDRLGFPAKYNKRVDIVREEYEGRPIYVLLPKGRVAKDKEIVFIHGGGGVMPPMSLHYESAVYLVEKTGVPLNFLRYPLAPSANCAGSTAWVRGWYEERLKNNPNKKFYVIGDSAGGTLSTALCCGGQKNVDGVILISPGAGWDRRSELMDPYEEHDILLSMKLLDGIERSWGSGMELTDWRINPAYVDYRDFPRTMIVYGGHEMFAGAIPEVVNRMLEAGVDLTLYKGEIHCHDWTLATMFPEAKSMLNIIGDFIGY